MWWIIPLVILFLICLIPFLRVRLCLAYEQELKVKLKVLFLQFTLFPQKQKRINAKDYSIKKLQKKQGKQKKQKTKKSVETHKQEHESKSKSITEILELIKIIIDNVLSPFGRFLKLEIAKIHVTIGSDDPAKTAIYYGLASQSIAYIVEFLSNVTNVSVKNKKSISVQPDFTSDRSEANINITFGLRVWHAVSLAMKFYLGYNKLTDNKAQQKQEECENGKQAQ